METQEKKVQEAYRTNNKNESAEVHTPEAIKKRLHSDHKDFSLSEVVLGGQDGLVNVLGVILGVAAASGEPRLIQAAGLAAAFAESVSMAAVAYTSSRTDAEYYESEQARENWEIEMVPEGEREEIRQIYAKRGFKGKLLEDVVDQIVSDKKVWLEVMMTEELQLQPISEKRALKAAVIVGISAIVGSIVPLLPFFFLNVATGMTISIILSALTLFIFGVYKARVTVGTWYRSGIELAIIGILSALAGYAIGYLFKAHAV